MPPRSVRDLQGDKAFGALDPATKQRVFEMLAADDKDYLALEAPVQAQVRDILLGPSVEAPAPPPPAVGAGAQRRAEIAQAPGFLERVSERVGMPLTDIPGALAGLSVPTSTQELTRGGRGLLAAVQAPFAAVGEAAETGARALGLRPRISPLSPEGQETTLGDIVEFGAGMVPLGKAAGVAGKLRRLGKPRTTIKLEPVGEAVQAAPVSAPSPAPVPASLPAKPKVQLRFDAEGKLIPETTEPVAKLIRVDLANTPPDPTKPHGAYFTLDVGKPSPHLDMGDTIFSAEARPQNLLEVQPIRIEHPRFGASGEGNVSAGISALKTLTSPKEFERLRQLDKGELIDELSRQFPGPDYTRYFDSYELLEAYGAQKARARGHDAILLRDPTLPEFSEFVALKAGSTRLTGKAPTSPPTGNLVDPAPAPTPTNPNPAPSLTEPQLRTSVQKDVTDLMGDFLTEKGITRDPDRTLISQAMDTFQTAPITELEAFLTRKGTTLVDFGTKIALETKAATFGGQTLNFLSQVSKRLKQQAKDNTPLGDALQGLNDFASEYDAALRGQSFWRRASNIYKGLLVSRVSTSVRNAISQEGRVAMEGMAETIEGALQKAFLPEGQRTRSVWDGLELVLDVNRHFALGNRRKVEEILAHYPKQYDRMFGHYLGDVARRARREGALPALTGKDKWFERVDTGVDVVNTLNKFQEFAFRTGTFHTEMNQALRQQGKNLSDIVQRGAWSEIPDATIRQAVNRALELTFSKSPDFGTFGYDLIRFANNPVMVPIIPFPRFLVNAAQTMWKFRPTAIFDPIAVAQAAKGNFAPLSKTITGSAMLGAAYLFRQSKFAGEKWNEVRTPAGDIDLVPFNPQAAYFFVAEMIRRHREGTLDRMLSKDAVQEIARNLTSMQLRQGAFIGPMNRALDVFTGKRAVDDVQGGLGQLGEMATELASGLLNPIRQLSDLLAPLDQVAGTEFGVARDPRGDVLGPLKMAVPGLQQTLPELERPTREAPVRQPTVGPVSLRFMGLLAREPKNPAERELDRLDFARREILPATGDIEADRAIAKHLGPLVERVVTPLTQGESYKWQSDDMKAVVLNRVLNQLYQAAKSQATAADPEKFIRLRERRRPIREQRLRRELGAGAGQ